MRLLVISLLTLCLFVVSAAQDTTDKELWKEYSTTYQSRLASLLCYLESGNQKDLMPLYFSSSPAGLEQDAYGGFSYSPSVYQGIWQLLLTAKAQTRRPGQKKQKLSEEKTLSVRDISPHRVESLGTPESENRKIPSGFDLVPAELFVAQLESPEMVDRLESCMTEYGAILTDELGVKLQFQEALATTLGLQDFSSLSPTTQEVYFVSEEISVKPAAHFAVILRTEVEIEEIRKLLNPDVQLERLGDHLVLSTSPQILKSIGEASRGEQPSMASDSGFQGSYGTLQWPRDGFVYVSKPYLERTYSPANWLLSRQRPHILGALAWVQYEALARRCQSGEWPDAAGLQIFEGPDFQWEIDERGIVSLPDWGSLYDFKALSDIPEPKFSEQDREEYESFKKSPQILAPYGVALSLSEQLSLHTDFTPAFYESTSEILKLAGTETITFQDLGDFPRLAAMEFHLSFDFEEILRRVFDIGENEPDVREQIEVKLKPFLGEVDFFKVFQNRVSFSMELEATRDLNRFRSLESGFKAVQKGYGIMVLSFHVTDLSLCTPVVERLKGFAFSEPMSHEGIEIVPLNLYLFYAFLVTDPHHIHFALNEASALRVCETLAEASTQKSRIFIQEPGKALIQVDFPSQLKRLWRGTQEQESQPDDQYLKGSGFGSWQELTINLHLSYLADMKIFQEALGPSADVESYFRHPPRHVYGIPLEYRSGEIFLDGLPLKEAWFPASDRAEKARKLVEKHNQEIVDQLESTGV